VDEVGRGRAENSSGDGEGDERLGDGRGWGEVFVPVHISTGHPSDPIAFN